MKKNKTISILGCGWLGFPLARNFIKKGYNVKGSTRSDDKSRQLQAEGVEAYIIDIENLEEKSLSSFLECDTIIISITSKNVEAHAHLCNKISQSAIRQVIYTSSTSVYPPGKEIVTEVTIVKNEHPLVAIEKNYYQLSQQEICIFRLSGLVGKERHPGRFFRNRPEASIPRVPVNLVHQQDVLRVFDYFMETEFVPGIFNVTSLEHPPKYHFYSAAYKDYFGKPAIFRLSDDKSGYKLISGEKLAALTGEYYKLSRYYPGLLGN